MFTTNSNYKNLLNQYFSGLNQGEFLDLYLDLLDPDCEWLFPRPKLNNGTWNLNEPQVSEKNQICYGTAQVSNDTVGAMLPKVSYSKI